MTPILLPWLKLALCAVVIGVAGQAPEFDGCGKGRAWRVPILERVDRLERTHPQADRLRNVVQHPPPCPCRS